MAELAVPGCPHGTYHEDIDRVACTKTSGIIWVGCHAGLCGDAPHCIYDPLDNSDEACARRLAWMKEHEKQGEKEHEH
jgi:hypothetical protein